MSGETPIRARAVRRGNRRGCGRIAIAALAALAYQLPIWACAPAAFADGPSTIVTDRRIADAIPHLPPATPSVGAVHRRADGQIELVDPTTRSETDARLCAAHTICVGEGQTYPTLSAALAVAHEHDLIEIAGGTYHESATVFTARLTIRGVNGQPHFDCAGIGLQDDKACLLLAADDVTLENLDISGAQISESAGANGACIRNEPQMSFTLRNIVCHASQAGIMSEGGTILVENSEFFDNGWNGHAHNVSFGGDCAVTVRGSIFRDSRVGHEFKSRCFKTTISDSSFRSTKGSRDLDIADGGETTLLRSVLTKSPGTDSKGLIGFATESCTHPANMLVKEVRIINTEPAAEIRNYDRCGGHAIILEAVTFEGIRPQLVGTVVDGTQISGIAKSQGTELLAIPLSQP